MPRLDPFLDVEVLEEITPVEYEARRRAANSDEALQQDNSFQRHASYAAFKLKDLWTSAAWTAQVYLCRKTPNQ